MPGDTSNQSSMELKIQIRGLRKAFGGKVVLDGLDLDVGVGESVLL